MRRLNPYILVAAAAIVGYLLLTLPGKLIAQRQIAAEQGPLVEWLYLISVTVGGILVVGSVGLLTWNITKATRQKRKQRQVANRTAGELSVSEKQDIITTKLAEADDLQQEEGLTDEERKAIQASAAAVAGKLESQSLEIVAFGTISSGKSSVLNALAGRDLFQTHVVGGTTVQRNDTPWPGQDRVTLVDTPGLSEVTGHSHEAIARNAAQSADLILFVVDGPLKHVELGPLRMLATMDKRILLCLNKADWYKPEDQAALIDQLREQTQPWVKDEDIVAVRASAAQRVRLRVTPDGREHQESVEEPADISPLAKRMMAMIRHDGRDLLLANLLLQSRALVDETREQLKGRLRERARAIVDRATWQAGGVAAVSPFPVVDIAAAAAVSAKMVHDLARVYRQPIDAAAAGRLVNAMARNLISILGVTAITPAVSALASTIKAVPGVGTIAGGLVQGLVQSLITQWIGRTFIRYFEEEMAQVEGGLAAAAREEWRKLMDPARLYQLTRDGLTHLRRSTWK